MRSIVPKHMKMEIKNKTSGQIRVVEKDYYSIGQVRELFREITSSFSMNMLMTADKFLRGKLKFCANTMEDHECEGEIEMDMYIDNITTTDDWNKLLARMEKRLKTIACGLPDPEDEATEITEYERVTEESENGIPKGKELTQPQQNLLELIFRDAGYGHDYIAPVFTKQYFLDQEGKTPLSHISQINSAMFDEFLGIIAHAAGRSEKPASFKDYTAAEKADIYKALREYIEKNNIKPLPKEEKGE